MRLSTRAEPWNEREKHFEGRLKAAAAWVNAHHDVQGLCREMPQRVHDLVHVTKGGRLDKLSAALKRQRTCFVSLLMSFQIPSHM